MFEQDRHYRSLDAVERARVDEAVRKARETPPTERLAAMARKRQAIRILQYEIAALRICMEENLT